MSLIRVRHSRRERGYDALKGTSTGRLVVLLAAVLALMWYLGGL